MIAASLVVEGVGGGADPIIGMATMTCCKVAK
jgi:hypothetical protein